MYTDHHTCCWVFVFYRHHILLGTSAAAKDRLVQDATCQPFYCISVCWAFVNYHTWHHILHSTSAANDRLVFHAVACISRLLGCCILTAAVHQLVPVSACASRLAVEYGPHAVGDLVALTAEASLHSKSSFDFPGYDKLLHWCKPGTDKVHRNDTGNLRFVPGVQPHRMICI